MAKATLRGQKPSTMQKRLKALFYGEAGVGKTTAAINFPRPYVVDTERGAENTQYAKIIESRGGVVFATTDPDELIKEVTTLLSTPDHGFQTLVIDPLSTIYNDLLDRGAETEGTEFGRHKIPADRKIKHLLNLLVRLDMNVVITSHSKAKWVRTKDAKGKDTVAQDGATFDCYPRLDYLFDLVFEVARRGNNVVGTVRKTRVENFAFGEAFDFSYDNIAKKYGREALERTALAEALASADQVAELKRLVGVLRMPDDIVSKWLDKAGAETFEEMGAEVIDKCIGFCKSKIETGKDGDA